MQICFRKVNANTGEGSGSAEMCIRDRSYDIRFRVYVPGQGRREMVKLLMNVEAQKKFYLKYRIVTRGISVSYTHLDVYKRQGV